MSSMKLFPGDVVKYASKLLPQNPFFISGVKPDTDEVLMAPVGAPPNAMNHVRALSGELQFLSHSTARMAQVVMHLVGALANTVDPESIAFMRELVEILDPDGTLTKVAEGELEKALQAEEPAQTVTESGLVAVGK